MPVAFLFTGSRWIDMIYSRTRKIRALSWNRPAHPAIASLVKALDSDIIIGFNEVTSLNYNMIMTEKEGFLWFSSVTYKKLLILFVTVSKFSNEFKTYQCDTELSISIVTFSSFRAVQLISSIMNGNTLLKNENQYWYLRCRRRYNVANLQYDQISNKNIGWFKYECHVNVMKGRCNFFRFKILLLWELSVVKWRHEAHNCDVSIK